MDLKLRFFLLPVIFAFLSSLFEGATFALLMPTFQGILKGDFLPIKESLFKYAPWLPLDSWMLGNPKIFIILLAMISIAVLLKNFFNFQARVLTSFNTRRFACSLRKKIFQRYLSFGKMFFDKNSAGYLQQVLVGNTANLSWELSRVQGLLSTFFNLVLYISIMFYISFQLTIFTFVLFPLLHFSVHYFIILIQRSSEEYSKYYAEIGKKISNALQCIPLIKAYSNEEKEQEWFNYCAERVEHSEYAIDRKHTMIEPVQEGVMLAGFLLLIAFIGYLVVPQKTGQVTSYIVFFLVLRRAMVSFGVFNQFLSSMASVLGPVQQIKLVFNEHGKFFIKDGHQPFEGLKEGIAFKDMSFHYPLAGEEIKPIFEHVDMTIRQGHLTAIVGASGAGKSTLISLLLRFYDVTAGNIFLDGKDIRDFSLSSLHEKISWVSQDTYLFNSSIRMNLLYGLPYTPEDPQIRRVLAQTDLLSLVDSLPQGINTEIGDRGISLSGGERQRLSIARALLRNTDILLLDEATSALDSTTEKLIQENLREFFKGKTSIVIAHRLSTVRHADHIIVLDQGRVVEQGPAAELLEKKGKFYEFWTNQQFY
jgi:subfamily B ATP-binding cassette protein MsbA